MLFLCISRVSLNFRPSKQCQRERTSSVPWRGIHRVLVVKRYTHMGAGWALGYALSPPDEEGTSAVDNKWECGCAALLMLVSGHRTRLDSRIPLPRNLQPQVADPAFGSRLRGSRSTMRTCFCNSMATYRRSQLESRCSSAGCCFPLAPLALPCPLLGFGSFGSHSLAMATAASSSLACASEHGHPPSYPSDRWTSAFI